MYVIEVIPLVTLPPNVPQVLSYYWDSELPKGSVVKVPLNHRSIQAIVISSSLLENKKILLKKSLFQLKSVTQVVAPTPQVSDYQFAIASWLSREYYSPLSLSFNHVLSPFFLKKKYPTLATTFENQPHMKRPDLIIGRAKKMLISIAPTISRVINGGGQVLIVVPEVSTIPYFYSQLSPTYKAGIIHSGVSNQDHYHIWEGVRSGSFQLIIGTRQALMLPYANLRHVIVDDPLHEFYKSDMSPKYDTAALARFVASLYKSDITFTTPYEGVDWYHSEKTRAAQIQRLQQQTNTQVKVVDMVGEIKSGYFSALSSTIKKQLNDAITRGQRALIFSSRRGHSGVLVCENCSFTAKCQQCDIPMRIHKAVDYLLTCHHCGSSQALPKSCANCNSYKFKHSGPAGSQKLFEELKRMMEFSQLPKVPVLILDSDVTQNETEAEEVVQEIKRLSPSILIATQKVFSYRYDFDFSYIAVPYFDALTTNPDYRNQDRLWYQVEKLLDFNPETLAVQTFNPKEAEVLIGDNYNQFYESELASRSLFAYPPFSKMVKLTYSHKIAAKTAQAGRLLIEKLKMALIQMQLTDKVRLHDSSPAFIKKEKGMYSYSIVLKILPGLENPRDILKYVPAPWHIDIDPRTII